MLVLAYKGKAKDLMVFFSKLNLTMTLGEFVKIKKLLTDGNPQSSTQNNNHVNYNINGGLYTWKL